MFRIRCGEFCSRTHHRLGLISKRLSRFVGTYVGVTCVYFRYNYWPQNFTWVDEPIMKCFSGISLAVEICYGITLWHIRKEERRQSAGKSK